MNAASSDGAPAGFIAGALVVYAVVAVVVLWAYVRITRRAGYSGWWVLIGLVPLVNFVMFLVFAFKQWPIQRELAQLKAAWSAQAQRGWPDNDQYPTGWASPAAGQPSIVGQHQAGPASRVAAPPNPNAGWQRPTPATDSGGWRVPGPATEPPSDWQQPGQNGDPRGGYFPQH